MILNISGKTRKYETKFGLRIIHWPFIILSSERKEKEPTEDHTIKLQLYMGRNITSSKWEGWGRGMHERCPDII